MGPGRRLLFASTIQVLFVLGFVGQSVHRLSERRPGSVAQRVSTLD